MSNSDPAAPATKDNIIASETGLRADIKAAETSLRSDFKATEAALRSDLKATEADLRSELKTAETGLRADIKATETALRSDLKAVETRLDKKIDRVAVTLVRTQADVRAIRESMDTTMATKDDVSRILAAIDAFAQKGESYDRKSLSHGAILNDHTAAIRDHGRRLDRLEAKD